VLSVQRMKKQTISAILITVMGTAIASAGCTERIDADEDVSASSVHELGAQHHGTYPLVPPVGSLGRHVYRQLAKGWLRWMAAIPAETNPATDETGAFCGDGQSGPIWYLAATFGGPATRSCDVPFGKFMFFPLVNSIVTVSPEELTATEDEAFWAEIARDFIPGARPLTCELTLRLDGHEILADTAERDRTLWTEVLDPFTLTVADDGVFGDFDGGVWPLAFIGGHFALFAPLTPGDHTLEFGGVLCDGGVTLFDTSVTYHLHVD
jgi:hypothetical protein